MRSDLLARSRRSSFALELTAQTFPNLRSATAPGALARRGPPVTVPRLADQFTRRHSVRSPAGLRTAMRRRVSEPDHRSRLKAYLEIQIIQLGAQKISWPSCFSK
jgi:hypothetical protein